MRLDTRFACWAIVATLALFLGCGGGEKGAPVQPPPANHPPEVTIVSGPADSIQASDAATFAWQGSDQDGNLAGYLAGLDGNLVWTTETTATYSGGFTPGSSHLFQVAAQDSDDARSDTADWAFAIYTIPPELILNAYGEGINDDDGDGFWSQFLVRWSPQITTGSSVDIRLLVGIQPTYGGGAEVTDSSEVITRNPGENDSLDFEIPILAKSYYDIRLELHGADGSSLLEIPYDSISSLTQVGLEELEGFNAWFDDAWIANEIDTLPPTGYYESIDLWWDVDALPDDGWVRVTVYERNSAGEERWLWQSDPTEISGQSNLDAFGIHITAGSTFGEYDYRLILLTHPEGMQIDEINYGEDDDLMDIPLGQSGGSHQNPTADQLSE